jgi:RNA polymerase sigma factor (sigma-70 family)
VTQHAGDFDDLYRRYAPAAFRRAARLLGNEADACEVVHDVFVSLFERPEQFSGESRMSTFLYSAVTHACLNRIRNRRTRERLLREQHEALRSSGGGDGATAHDRTLLRALLTRMPEPLGEVAVYYYMDELTHEEIARVIGCSRRHVGDLVERLLSWARNAEAS